MIRTNPAHDVKNPPGQHCDCPLHKEITDYKSHEYYLKGYDEGYKIGQQHLLQTYDTPHNCVFSR